MQLRDDKIVVIATISVLGKLWIKRYSAMNIYVSMFIKYIDLEIDSLKLHKKVETNDILRKE